MSDNDERLYPGFGADGGCGPVAYAPSTIRLRQHVPDAVGDVEYNLAIHERDCKSHWRTHVPAHHIWKAVKHLFWYAVGSKREPHLTHAATRLLFALQLAYEKPWRHLGGEAGVHYGAGRDGTQEK